MIENTFETAEVTWREDAACLTHPGIVFFGVEDLESPAEKRSREDRAKDVCSGCAVKRECLEYALAAREPYGIWGGLTELERKAALRARANRQPAKI
ncbi:MAG: WhiB family transcriptional regulator [Actinomycetota bacterium]